MTWILKSWSPWTRHDIAIVLAAMMLAATAVYLADRLVRPQPVTETVMGDRWQCTRTALVITTCTKKPIAAIARTPIAAAGFVPQG